MAKKLSKAESRHRRFAQSRYASIERENERKDAAPQSSTQRDAAKE